MKQLTHRRTHAAGAPSTRHAIAAAVVALASWLPLDAAALGLGKLSVQSSLGETLRAEIDVTALAPEEASTLKVRIATPEAYRAAGVDYNAALSGATVSLQRRADGKPYLRVSGDRTVQEPFVDVILEINWSTGRLMREFTLLFDPPTSTRLAQQAPSTPAVIAPAPSAAPAPAASSQPIPQAEAPSAPAPQRPAPVPRPTPAPATAAKPTAPTAGNAASSDEVRVERGDTLYRIATRTQQSGVSLDQMLVALYRNNSDAFIGNNMNRLKAGSLLKVPSAEQANSVTPAEARQVIQAQSADFGAYREKLAGGVPTTVAPDSSRSASGKVQAEVQDRKTSTAQTPDKLTLSKGAVAAGKASGDEKVAKSREQKDSATRVAELSKNVEELKKLQQGTQSASAAGATGAAAAASKPGLAVTAPVTVPPATPAASAAATAPTPAPAPAVAASAPAQAASPAAPAMAAAPAPTASAPSQDASQAPVAAAPAAEPASAPVAAAASEPAPAAPPRAPEVDGPGLIDSLLENPLLLPGAGLLVALLAGIGFYRMRQGKRDSGETSFLESRLQPDSFFGASGGQRVDTRDATGVPSSMSYSLSQLDAIGDVDPVAEADVYLAYGRDLQAEEILKEAMRSNPDRMAIRLKLLEVYAKRRDTKGYELLASQLYSLTGGQGEDWARAQQLGASIDPDHPMYQPGGRPVGVPDGGAGAEALGASTMPQSVLPSPSRYEAQRTQMEEPERDLDLDLDVSVPGTLDDAPVPMPERTQPFESPTPASAAPAFDFELPSLDLDTPAAAPAPAVADELAGLPDLARLDLDANGADDEALARKLELADEFRQIGDLEGARDLLQEVVSQSGGTLKAKAQGMLKEIG